MYLERFVEGAAKRGVPEETAHRIFGKVNGDYMFPESHSHAFAVTAYQAAWLKRYHPLEFFVTLINNQPMGFYPSGDPEGGRPAIRRTIPEPVREPQRRPVRATRRLCAAGAAVRQGRRRERCRGHRGGAAARRPLHQVPGDLARRTGLKPQAMQSLVQAGAFDALVPNRRRALWDSGLAPRSHRNGQRPLAVPGGHIAPSLDDFTEFERMMGEYRVMGIYPRGHVMEFVRPDPRRRRAAHVSRWRTCRTATACA